MAIPIPPSVAGDCFYFESGAVSVTALCDETFDIGKELLVGAAPDAIDTCLPGGSTPASCNAYLVEMAGAAILVDTGAGDVFDGQAMSALAKAGIAPERVDLVLLTHLHLDHVAGLLHKGVPVFPNAEIWQAASERDFWFDDTAVAAMAERLTPSLGEDFVDTHVKIARNALAAYADKVHVFSGECEIASGVKTVPLHGHTPGHSGYLFGSGKDRFLAWGDVVHAAAVQFSLPEAGMVFDWDARAATGTRRRVFAEAADGYCLIAGMHLPFPGVGRVRRDGGAYCFIPLAGQ